MKIRIMKASNFGRKEIRENQTSQDILNIIEEFDQSIIIEKVNSEDDIDNVDYDITIYDDWVE